MMTFEMKSRLEWNQNSKIVKWHQIGAKYVFHQFCI